MAQRCELTGTGVQSGNNVSHSNRKTRRRFLPNLQRVSFTSEVLGKFSLKITAATLRSIDHNGGIDAYLVKTNCKDLTAEGQKLRRKIKKALPQEKKAASKKVVKYVSGRQKALEAKKKAIKETKKAEA